jgi:hypothetical protein
LCELQPRPRPSSPSVLRTPAPPPRSGAATASVVPRSHCQLCESPATPPPPAVPGGHRQLRESPPSSTAPSLATGGHCRPAASARGKGAANLQPRLRLRPGVLGQLCEPPPSASVPSLLPASHRQFCESAGHGHGSLRPLRLCFLSPTFEYSIMIPKPLAAARCSAGKATIGAAAEPSSLVFIS